MISSRWVLPLLLISPIPLGALITVLDLSITDEYTRLQTLAVVWSVIALGAVCTTAYLTVRALIAYLFSRREYPPASTERLLAAINLLSSAGLLVVHTLFLFIGVMTVVLDVDSIVRVEISRLGLLEGQYVLLVMGIGHYLLFRRVRENVKRSEREA